MKKILLFAIASLVLVSGAFAQKKNDKVNPRMYSGEFYGIPVKLRLPFGKHEQIYAVPLAEEIAEIGTKKGGSAAVFLCTDTLVFDLLTEIGKDGDTRALLYGIRIDPFHNWGKVQQEEAAAVLGKGSVKDLKKFIWLDLTSYDPGKKTSGVEGSKKKNMKELY